MQHLQVWLSDSSSFRTPSQLGFVVLQRVEDSLALGCHVILRLKGNKMMITWQSMRHPRHAACRGSDNVSSLSSPMGHGGVLRPTCPNGLGAW